MDLDEVFQDMLDLLLSPHRDLYTGALPSNHVFSQGITKKGFLFGFSEVWEGVFESIGV